MQDYKKHLNRTIALRTTVGEFHGKLVGVGRSTLTIEVDAYYGENGERGNTPSGQLVFDRFAIHFAQVK